MSSGSLIPSHRVTRRKSVTTNTSNVAALVAAVAEGGEIPAGIPISTRRNTVSKNASARSGALGSLPSPPASLPNHRIVMTSIRKSERDENAIEDDDEIEEEEEEETSLTKSRQRRASDGQHLTNGKKVNTTELKCDKCGKGYKHSSCLTKHLWEHTPEWSFTSKLLISKHQQVQLLEAASVLVAMNQDGATPPDSAKDFQSDQESASPAASGSSDQQDRASSADTTPPPHDSYSHFSSGSYSGRNKRYSSGSGFSRSYQSAASATTMYTASVPTASGFGNHERRPPSSGFNRTSQEDDQLAAAIDLLSCSFGSNGTPRTIPVTLPEDAPPVPNIPAHYLSGTSFSATTLTSSHPRQPESFTRHRNHRDEDVKMDESEDSVADDEDYDHHSRGRSDEDDDGVFGRMEE